MPAPVTLAAWPRSRQGATDDSAAETSPLSRHSLSITFRTLSIVCADGRSRCLARRARPLDEPQPTLAPVRVDAPRAEPVEVTGADEAVDDDAVGADRQHLSRLLVDDVLDAA